MSGNDRTDSAKEFTMTKYNQSGNGTEFVALQLALDFEDFENRKLLATGDPAPVDPMAERPASHRARRSPRSDPSYDQNPPR